MDVIVTTPAQRSRTMLRERGMSGAAHLDRYARSMGKSPHECQKKIVGGGKRLDKA
jgi:hypothetical protein